MADSTREYKYKLNLGANLTTPTAPFTELQLVQSSTDMTIGDVACKICLNGVKFFRKMYEPGLIEAEVTIKTQDAKVDLPPIAPVKELFIKREAKLIIMPTDTNTDETIAENYYVYMVNPALTMFNDVASYYVKLSVYSMDKLMAIDKYSKAYVSKRLAMDILKKEYTNFGLKEGQVLAEIENLKHMTYKDRNQKDDERIQPYLVQYNETFHDFLVRTANRCGEFLYFEDGKLTIGLPQSDKSQEISTYASVTVQDFSGSKLEISSYARDGVKDNDTIKGFNADAIEKDGGYPKEAFPESIAYNAELTHDDFIFPMKKDNFTSFSNELGISTSSMVLSAFQKIATNDAGYTAIPEMIRSFGSDLATAAIGATKSNSEGNSEGNEAFIDIFKEDSAQTDGSTTVQFGTVLKGGWPTLEFYTKVHNREKEQQQQMVCIDMGVNYTSVKLGDKITIKGVSGTYVVTSVTMCSDDAWSINYRKFQEGDQSDVYSGSQSQQIWAIPTYIDKEMNIETAIPPLLQVPVIRKSGPQTAFVIDNSDPKHQGRVRIAYPWQSVGKKTGKWADLLKDVATPWIRVVSPMATDGGGAYFLPNTGDEVLVNYDNDNIERPYVVGSVYSKNLNEPNGAHNGNMTLQTPNGQFITLSSAKGSKFLENIAPFFKQLNTIIPGTMKEALKGIDKQVAGGITMSDAYGLFKIDMSSHGRKIDIESPFGKVGISAFTGITINAPNGDVKICGKNVSIEAGNNLSIKSGTNVNYDDFSLADTIKSMIGDTIKEVAGAALDLTGNANLMNLKFVDCALIRCVMDTFLRPVEGTLCIKSNNYLKLEAGKGKAEVPLDRYSPRWQDYKKAEKDGEKQIVYSKLAAFAKRLDGNISKFCSDYREAKQKAYEKKAAYDWLVDHLVKKDKVDSLQDIRKEAFKLTDEFKKHKVNNSTTPATIEYGLVKMDCFTQDNLQKKWYPGYWVSGKTFLRNENDIQNHILEVAEEYAEAVYDLHRRVLSATNIISDQTLQAINLSVLGRKNDDETSWMDDIFKQEAQSIIETMFTDWKTRYGSSDPTDDFLSDEDKKSGKDPFAAPKLYKRLAMAKMLVKIHDHEKNKMTLPAAGAVVAGAVAGPTAALPQPGKFFKLNIQSTTTIDLDYVDKNWKELASLGEGKPSKTWKILKFLAEFLGIDKQWKPILDPNAPLKGWAQKVWNDKSGQIIFSNKKGTTYALNGEQIEKYEFRTEKNKESLQKTLMDLGHEEGFWG